MKDSTIYNRKIQLALWEKALGSDRLFHTITVRDIVIFLDAYEDRPSMADKLRQSAVELWIDAMHEGWAEDNIPDKTRNIDYDVMRDRLTMDQFKQIHAVALQQRMPWVARAMELALITAQRREDIAVMEFRQRKGSSAWVEDDHLCVVQIKTDTKVRIPMNVGLNGWTIDGVVKLCRDNVVSTYFLHAPRIRGNRKHQTIDLGTISRAFAECRKLAGITWTEGKRPPSFHEIRSLAIREYKKKFGKEFGQAIAGHKNASTTELYCDVRGAEWVEVKVA